MIIEIDKGLYVIPASNESLITPSGQHYKQIHEILVRRTEIKFPPLIYYVRFEDSPVYIAAGGETLEITQNRLRWQMVDKYQIDSAALKNPNPPLNAQRAVEIIQQYIHLL